MRNMTVPVSPIYFNIAEYCLFGIVLCVIIGIILYYNVVNTRYSTVADFLFAVFHKLQLSSSFEYLEIRFSTHTRTIAAVLFVVSKLMILPIVPYVPLMAFRLVTNPLAGRITAVICVACATFSAVGGLRAIVAIGIGTTFLAIADPELAHHTSFFAVTLALSTNWLWKIALSQSTLQKLQAVPTIKKARLCLMLSCIGVILMKLLSCFLGLALYAWFAGCDPLLSGQIKKHEQLLCVLVGLYSGSVVWFSKDLDKLQHVASGVTGATAGTLLGLFTLGIVFSRANCSGALSGCLLSLVLCGWLLIGAENALASGALTFQGKPLVASGCGKGNFTHPFVNISAAYKHTPQVNDEERHALL
ncbi:putative igf2 mRNA binding protein [Operophtera brumata]|uniref:Putative igf2 mRNA binding protein n=1 Tax=Operophtera brumata TaxID=104452 RepID=A0A0L7L199_OPEBR|nr:putative igf2 mRNA binding protein [Operophtera brumata]